MRDELAQARFRLLARAAGRKAEVELSRGEGRHDVLRDPALDPHRAQHLAVDEPVELDLERLEARERRETFLELVERVAARPRPGRMGPLAMELEPRLQVPEAAGMEDRVRGLEHDRELGSREDAAPARRRGGALPARPLPAPEG